MSSAIQAKLSLVKDGSEVDEGLEFDGDQALEGWNWDEHGIPDYFILILGKKE